MYGRRNYCKGIDVVRELSGVGLSRYLTDISATELWSEMLICWETVEKV